MGGRCRDHTEGVAMRLLLIALAALAVSAGPAEADVDYGSTFRPFDAGDWTVSGDGVSLLPGGISWVGPTLEPAQTGDAVVGSAGSVAGVEFEFIFASSLGYASIAIVDDSGLERLLLYTDHSANVFGIFEGMLIGPISRSDAPHHVTLVTPAQGANFAWSLSVVDLGSGDSIDLTGNSRTEPAPFLGPIALRLTADNGMPASLVSYLRLIGDNFVPTENTSWSEVKALYR